MPGVIYVGLGGACGAIGRYFLSLLPNEGRFPIWTLLTNVIGAVAIGFIVGIVEANPDVSPKELLFWKTGVCGGFTTFSTFSLEALMLMEQGKTLLGIVYVLLSVTLCILGVYIGKMIYQN